MDLPEMIRVRQRFEAPVVEDIGEDIATRMNALDLDDRISPGQSVAVACSSRGIANYAEIVSAVVAVLKQWGLQPFLVPAVGYL